VHIQNKNIVDDKSEEYSEKITLEEDSNIQQTATFKTVKSKEKKEIRFKNYSYANNQLNEVKELRVF
jgi:hypothetical protein